MCGRKIQPQSHSVLLLLSERSASYRGWELGFFSFGSGVFSTQIRTLAAAQMKTCLPAWHIQDPLHGCESNHAAVGSLIQMLS